MKNGVTWQWQMVMPEKKRIIDEIKVLDADPYALRMWEKGVPIVVKVLNVKSAAANIIKQESLAADIDAAVSRNTINCKAEATDVLILGTVRGIRKLAERLKRQVFNLPLLADELLKVVNGSAPANFKIRDRYLPLNKSYVMGILNCTPDSFSDGGLYSNEELAIKRVDEIIAEGATFIDIGGVSTRPSVQKGLEPMPTVEEELKRILPAVKYAVNAVKGQDIYVSVDTFRSEVAEVCLDLGVDLINDQYAFSDDKLSTLCADKDVSVCLMYQGGAKGVHNFIKSASQNAINKGVDKARILLDPGFGFGKNLEEQYYLLHYLSELCNLEYPILVGVSRKSMLGEVVGKEPAKRGAATISAEVCAALAGAAVIRTHAVADCVDALKVADKIKYI